METLQFIIGSLDIFVLDLMCDFFFVYCLNHVCYDIVLKFSFCILGQDCKLFIPFGYSKPFAINDHISWQ